MGCFVYRGCDVKISKRQGYKLSPVSKDNVISISEAINGLLNNVA